MAKRKLSDKQKHRAKDLQHRRVAAAQNSAAEESESLGPAQDGLVISHFGKTLLVESAEGSIAACRPRQNLEALVVGDHIVWQALANKPDEGVVIAVKPRRNLLERPLYHGTIKPVAANIDQIIILASPTPQLQPALIDRYLVGTEAAGIDAIIAFNKIDLARDETLNEIVMWRSIYDQLGYKTLTISAKHGTHADELISVLRGKTSILVGQSGVGKSSTTKLLVPDIDIQTAELVKSHDLGKHRTTTSRLYHLPFGGDLIDSPGVRDFGVWNVPTEKIAWAYREFRPFLGTCKFKDCRHRQEIGCSIKEAIQRGEIHAARLENFHEIVDRVKEQQERG